ncbi:MAG: hypothetical protein ABIZ34_10615 [Candidatus Limnocylindrales bacterium]
MEAIIVLIMTVLAFDVLAVRFGTDSRDLIEDDHRTHQTHGAI